MLWWSKVGFYDYFWDTIAKMKKLRKEKGLDSIRQMKANQIVSNMKQLNS